MEYESTDYDSVDLSDLSSIGISDDDTLLDEIPDNGRFVTLDDWLEIDDLDYIKY